jgi:serine/threonine protein kinase
MQPRGEEAVAALREEIDLMRRLRHEHVVRYLGTATNSARGDEQYILMELCAGGSVGGLLRREHQSGLPDELLWRYGVQLLRGLHFLHTQMIIHRDLKGDNVLLQPRPPSSPVPGGGQQPGDMVVKIADFGSAFELAGDATREGEANAMRGSPYWMSPEHVRGANCGRKADIWSYGATLLEMLTGRPPWHDATAPASSRRTRRRCPPPARSRRGCTSCC